MESNLPGIIRSSIKKSMAGKGIPKDISKRVKIILGTLQ